MKAKHPHNRAERLRLKAKKDRFDYNKDHVERRLREEELEQKEALDALRKQILEDEIERSRN